MALKDYGTDFKSTADANEVVARASEAEAYRTSRGRETSSVSAEKDYGLGIVNELIGRIKASFPEFFLAASFIGFVVMVTFGKLSLNFKNIGYYFFTIFALFLLYIIAKIIDKFIFRKFFND
ncbi:hypothetical protein HYW35_04050 [Candidatus Saccharibacteria bacterium]|nr:hypothetical protein [Candidatus Saccharibacteria bacterium]